MSPPLGEPDDPSDDRTRFADVGLGSVARSTKIVGRLPSRLVRNPAQLVAALFALAIVIGTLLLMIPGMSEDPGAAPFMTALFTSTSAVSVTGLQLVDTGTYWTGAGHATILVLVQLGGLGILTSTSIAFLVATRRLGLRGKLVGSVEQGALRSNDFRLAIRTVLLVTFAAELLIAVGIAVRLAAGGADSGSAIWRGVFHSVSAFNNAGFSLWPESLTRFAADPAMIGLFSAAIVAGGLGVPVWIDLRRSWHRPRRWSLHTKLTLVMSGALVIFGAGLITWMEWGNAETLGSESASTRIMGGIFASISSRSAGFSTFDYGFAREETLFLTDSLMFAGAGAASTGGGIKVTTLAVLFLIAWSEIRSKGDVEAFGRAIPAAIQRRAIAITVIGGTVVFFGAIALLQGVPFDFTSALFEGTSALTTTGLSVGLAPSMPTVAIWTLVAMMFIGRVGLITVMLAFALRERPRAYRNPEERPIVG